MSARRSDTTASRPHWMTRYVSLTWGFFCGIAFTIAYTFAVAFTPWAWIAVAGVAILSFVGAGCGGTADGREMRARRLR